MATLLQFHDRPTPARQTPRVHILLGRQLVRMGAIRADQLLKALRLQPTLDAPIGEILMAEGWVEPDQIETALAAQHRLPRADLHRDPPESSLCRSLPSSFWLHHRVIPWKREDGRVLVATSRPDLFETLRGALGDVFGDTAPVLAGDAMIAAAIAAEFSQDLAASASERVAPEYSCRNWRHTNRTILPAVLLLMVLALALAPAQVFAMFCVLAVASLTLFALLKLVAASANLLAPLPGAEQPEMQSGTPLPRVSVLVPLFREREILGDLLARLDLLTYPRALLEVILVLEQEDDVTRATLSEHSLPGWIRVIEVPAHGGLTTKPRAMNYALDFCRGDIIGVWDAEDAPEPDQIETVAARFAIAPPEVVCLQGVLDYYNPRTNWLARCFTIEYSAWFRVILPGIARLGLVVPLGGTTLFFRRSVLEELGGWDAHNVTEDADLGVRLCRAGYRTEMIPTTTYEEANCRPWPWIKQRSRWLKGFMVTYLVHMRDPLGLLRDLGPWRFLGVQTFFIGTLSQFLLAPALWSFWLILAGQPHPLLNGLASSTVMGLCALFLAVEILGIILGAVGVWRGGRRSLALFVPTMIFYFPLGCIAAYKALYELLMRPFYWDKTQHGHAAPETGSPAQPVVQPVTGPEPVGAIP